VAYLVVYDLPSENRRVYGQLEKEVISNARVKATYHLHKLGLLVTESSVLVIDKERREIENTISKVYEIYDEAASEIRQLMGAVILEPKIRFFEITREQTEVVKELAIGRVIRAVNESIEVINEILEGIRRTSRRRLLRLRREWDRTKTLLEILGENTNDVEYLIEMIDEALEKIKEGE